MPVRRAVSVTQYGFAVAVPFAAVAVVRPLTRKKRADAVVVSVASAVAVSERSPAAPVAVRSTRSTTPALAQTDTVARSRRRRTVDALTCVEPCAAARAAVPKSPTGVGGSELTLAAGQIVAVQVVTLVNGA